MYIYIHICAYIYTHIPINVERVNKQIDWEKHLYTVPRERWRKREENKKGVNKYKIEQKRVVQVKKEQKRRVIAYLASAFNCL